MPKINEVLHKRNKNGKIHMLMLWKACDECGVERWVGKRRWENGKQRICHHCFVLNHSLPLKGNPCGEQNPSWKGGLKIVTGGYQSIRIYKGHPEYEYFKPMIKSDGYILEHRYIMAKAIGRLLTNEEIVHHIDGNRKNNLLINLKLTNSSDHDLSYKSGYEQGFKDGVKYAQSLN